MSYGWKHLNHNTGDPYHIGAIINDYLAVGDHETLKSMGLTQSIINDLESGTPFYDPSRLYGLGEPFDSVVDYVTTGRIDPSTDLNIPGDLWKWQFWDPSTVPDEKWYAGGQGRRTWSNERRFNQFNQNNYQYLSQGIASGTVTLVPGEVLVPPTASNTYVHPSLTKFETAPSVNRLLSLWNAYGGDRSYILTALMGFSNKGGPRGLFLLTDRVLGAEPELANYPVTYGIPFGQDGGENFYYNWMMKNAYNGTYSGFKYAQMRNIWAEGREPYNHNQLDPNTGTWYTQDEIYHDWGVPDKIQVPAYYRKFQGGLQGSACHYEIRYFWDIAPTGFGFQSKYSSGEEIRYGPFRGEDPRTVRVQLPSGLIVEEDVRGFPDDTIPFLEWPDVWDGTTFRPGKCPITRLLVFDEREPYIEFIKEVSEHCKAINEWFNDGCPCDWQDYGGYVDPVVQAETAAAEAATVSAATQYVPTSTTSATPPPNPKFGDLWRDSTTGKTKTFVQISPIAGTWADS